jgi:hypothetical protein
MVRRTLLFQNPRLLQLQKDPPPHHLLFPLFQWVLFLGFLRIVN